MSTRIRFYFFTLIFLCATFGLSANEGDDVLVKTSDFSITKKMLMDEINFVEGDRREFLTQNPEKLREYIDIYYRETLFENLALKQGLDKTAQFQAKLAAAKRRLLANEVMAHQKSQIKLPDMLPMAKEYYAVNKEALKTPEQAEVRHILLKFNEAKESKEAARLRLVKIAQDLKKHPDQFETIAKQYSEDKASAMRGGYLGKLRKGQTVAEFEAQAFALRKPGQLSDVFASKFGYHLVQCVQFHPAALAKFEDIKDALIAKLRDAYVEDEYARWRTAIADPKKAQVDEDKLVKFIRETTNTAQ
jgi:peptidyl-prolyl cis-trans isomerase C